MKISVVLQSLLLAVFLAGCNGGSGSSSSSREVDAVPSLTLSYMGSPIDLGSIQADFAANTSYGEFDRNVFDIFIPASDTPTPLVIYVHGGGFTAGDKSDIYERESSITEFLAAGVAFASINYRLISSDIETEGVIKSLSDSKRALQFIRYHANTLNIDKTKIAVYGGSAGAGTALWLGTHDDLADAKSSDPILRESSRIVAAGAIETQGTYDLVKWETLILKDFGITFESVGAISQPLVQFILSFQGVTSIDDFYTPEGQAYRKNVDMLGLMDANDAPIWVNNFRIGAGFPVSVDDLFHHPQHAKVLLDRAEEVGLENQVYIPLMGIGHTPEETWPSFAMRHLGVSGP